MLIVSPTPFASPKTTSIPRTSTPATLPLTRAAEEHEKKDGLPHGKPSFLCFMTRSAPYQSMYS